VKERILEIGKGSAWYLVAQVSYAFMGFLSVPIFTRIFNPSGYGVYSLVSTTVGLVTMFFSIWLTSSVIRFYAEYDKKNDVETFYSTVFRYAPHFIVATLAVALPVAAFILPLGKDRLVVCLGIAITAFMVLFVVCLSMLQARQMAGYYAVIYIVFALGRYLLGAGIAKWLSTGPSGIFWGWLAVLLLLVPVELIVLGAGRKVRWSRYSPKLFREFFTFGFVLIFVNVLANVLSVSDRYMVGAFKGSFQVGLYSVVYTLVMDVYAIILAALQLGAFPVIIKTYEFDGEQSAIHLISRVTRYLLILTLPSALGMYLLRIRLLSVITTAKYLPAASVMLPLSLGILLNSAAWLPSMSLYIKKKTKLTLIPVGVASVINIGLNLILIPRYGYTAAAWDTLIAYVVFFILMVDLSRRYMQWKFPWLDSLKILAATAATGLALYFLNRIPIHGAGGLVLIVVSGTVIFFAVLLAVRGITVNELEFAAANLGRLPYVGKFIGGNEPPEE
jgi:O-antigen/teichoic acid export membrane protein